MLLLPLFENIRKYRFNENVLIFDGKYNVHYMMNYSHYFNIQIV